MKIKNILLGAHVSIAGGLNKAIKRAQETGANCFQVFTKSNRQWYAKEITTEEQNDFIEKLKNSSISIVIAHASYLINLGSANNAVVKKSIESLSQELKRCEQLNIPYLVLHPGTAHLKDEQKSLEFIANRIDEAITISKTKKVFLLIETMAGQGKTIGYKFSQLATIIKNTNHKRRIGICFDTCHVFVAGYDFSTKSSYDSLWKEFDETIGIKKLKAFHINDSKKEFGSKIDRHENIGQGKIPINSFSLIMNDKRFADIPKIIETPEGLNKIENDKKNIEKLYDLA